MNLVEKTYQQDDTAKPTIYIFSGFLDFTDAELSQQILAPKTELL